MTLFVLFFPAFGSLGTPKHYKTRENAKCQIDPVLPPHTPPLSVALCLDLPYHALFSGLAEGAYRISFVLFLGILLAFFSDIVSVTAAYLAFLLACRYTSNNEAKAIFVVSPFVLISSQRKMQSLNFQRVTIRGAQPSPRLSEEICFSKRFLEALRGSLRAFCGALQGCAGGFFEDS